jgi:endonuclease/exonuclease/phosphatase family metal-dependent hydrolase
VITVATYNTFHCAIPETKRVDYAKYASVIKGLGAGLVALQEIDYKTSRSGGKDQARELATRAGFPYWAFGKSMNYDGGQYGNAILSQYPLSNIVTYPIPKVISGEPRCLVTAVAELPDRKKVRFGSTHWGLVQSERMVGVGVAASLPADLPRLVGGDLNCRRSSIEGKCLDVFFDFVQADPQAPGIDHIFYRGPFAVLEYYSVEDGNGDHDPFVAKLELNG